MLGKTIFALLLLTVLLPVLPLAAQELTWGATRPIIEVDLRALLKTRVAEAQRQGKFRDAQRQLEEMLRGYARRPVDLGLPPAPDFLKKTIALTLPENIGQLDPVIVNYLKEQKRSFLFFSADREEEMQAAAALMSKISLRPVLVAGDVLEAEKALGTRVWADQGGALTRRFFLTASPALVELRFPRAHITTFTPDQIEEVLRSRAAEEAP